MQLVKAKDVASNLNLSPETILKLARQERLPHYRIGKGSVRFRIEEVEAWLVQSRHAGPDRTDDD